MNRLAAFQVQQLYRQFENGASARRAALVVGCNRETALRYLSRHKYASGFSSAVRTLHQIKTVDGLDWLALQRAMSLRFALKTTNQTTARIDWWIEFFFQLLSTNAT